MKTYFSLIVTISLIAVLFTGVYIQNASADVVAPKKQIKFGIPSEDILCESGTFKVTKKSDDSIACIKPNNVAILVSLGWAKPVDENKLGAALNMESVPIATINKLYLEPRISNLGKLSPKSPVSGYDFTFEVCASQKIYVPDVLVKSDSETIHYEIPENIESDKCVLSSIFIKAADPNTIKAILQNKGDVSKIISETESKVASLKEELSAAKKAIGDKSAPDTTQGAKIVDLRKQLNDANEDLYRLYFAVYAAPSQKYTIERLSFTGAVIEGEQASVVAVKKSVSGEDTYDVIFEACAGKESVRLHVISATSDKETINVKLGDKIAPNTYQMTSTKIFATDPNSVTVMPAGNAVSSTEITELESNIAGLQKQLKDEKQFLRALLIDIKKPENLAEQVESHTANIISLRDQINALEDDYNALLYQAYKS